MTKEQIRDFTLRTSNSNHSGLILVLFDMEKVYVDDAINAYEAEDIDEYISKLEMAKRVLTELIDCVNPSDVNGKKIISVFRYIFSKLVRSVVVRKPDELDRCLGMMDNLREAFEYIHEIDDEAPMMQNTQKVYAGLTYGRGTLNENVQGNEYSRGFKA